LAALLLAPAVAFAALAAALDRWVTWNPRRPGPSPTGRSVERLAADLRRLRHDWSRVTTSDQAAAGTRLRAVALAYDDTLYACCLALEVPEPRRPPLDALGRLETEAALAQRGLTW
jgi:hypothetical protein